MTFANMNITFHMVLFYISLSLSLSLSLLWSIYNLFVYLNT